MSDTKDKYHHDHAGHRERLKKRYIENGLDSFEDHQALELLLFYGCPRKDTNALAHRMIKEFGTLHNLLEAHPLEIANRCKVSKHVAALVSIIPPMAKRYTQSRWDKKESLDSSRKAGEFAISLFIGETVEYFYVICLNSDRRLIRAVKMSRGTVTNTPVYPRETINAVLQHNAVSVILAHNHPGGIKSPSRADIEITKTIINSLKLINVDVLDHIIVIGNEYFSFSENKTLAMWY